ncbi:MAG: helix-turn-helix domain-containing protein [Bifidobacteriaceae bacterium]|jgi:transcriptional regulator with XRE-family HTH domain|nr:helix-turn-helix domain-containing protein [Bifidobacteriaceae bacterium]
MVYRGHIRDPETLGRMLAEARHLRGLTQRDLARELGVSQRYIWEMEAGAPTIATTRLFAAMAATGMSLVAEIEPPGAQHG